MTTKEIIRDIKDSKIAKRATLTVSGLALVAALGGCAKGTEANQTTITYGSGTTGITETVPTTTGSTLRRTGVETGTTLGAVEQQAVLPNAKDAEQALVNLGVKVEHAGIGDFDHKLKPDEYFLVPVNSVVVGDVEFLTGFDENNQPVWDRSFDNRPESGAITEVDASIIVHGLPSEYDGNNYGDGSSVANIHLKTGTAIRANVQEEDAQEMLSARKPAASIVDFFKVTANEGLTYVGTLTAAEISAGKVKPFLKGDYNPQGTETTVTTVYNSTETTQGQTESDHAMKAGETYNAPAHSIVLGDVFVDGIQRCDSNDNTGLIVELPNGGKVKAPWAADVQTITDPELYATVLARDKQEMLVKNGKDKSGYQVDVITVSGPNDKTVQGQN